MFPRRATPDSKVGLKKVVQTIMVWYVSTNRTAIHEFFPVYYVVYKCVWPIPFLIVFTALEGSVLILSL